MKCLNNMKIEQPGNRKENIDPEKLREAMRLFAELDQKAAELCLKIENSAWIKPTDKYAESSKDVTNYYARLELVKTIIYGLSAALMAFALTGGSETSAWVIGSLTGVERLTKAMHYLNNEIQLGDLKNLLTLAKQKIVAGN